MTLAVIFAGGLAGLSGVVALRGRSVLGAFLAAASVAWLAVAATSSGTVVPAAALAVISICSTALGAVVWRALDQEE